MPVWMWTSADSWEPVSRTASVSGVSVTATATPTRTRWSMGDGTSVTCKGRGTRYTASRGASKSPTCGHTYTAPSTVKDSGKYRITASTHWSIQWEGAGESGAESMERSASTSLRISEGQGLNQ